MEATCYKCRYDKKKNISYLYYEFISGKKIRLQANGLLAFSAYLKHQTDLILKP